MDLYSEWERIRSSITMISVGSQVKLIFIKATRSFLNAQLFEIHPVTIVCLRDGPRIVISFFGPGYKPNLFSAGY